VRTFTRLLLALALVLPLSAASVAYAQEEQDPEHNKAVAVAFYDMAVNQKAPDVAVALYVGPRYTQHNPLAADGKEAFIRFFRGFSTQFPDAYVDIRRVIAEGDLVITHSHFTVSPEDRGSAVVDIFRFENGKVVEHWDVIQMIPETPLNDNTMF
jgi:predicted SnoaL-like aldol condensation-catalyzing enzyme